MTIANKLYHNRDKPRMSSHEQKRSAADQTDRSFRR